MFFSDVKIGMLVKHRHNKRLAIVVYLNTNSKYSMAFIFDGEISFWDELNFYEMI